MNQVTMMGRIATDPEVRYSVGATPVAIATYRLAVDRRYAKEGGQKTDFIPCKSLGKSGEFVERYLRKGMKMVVIGSWHADQYKDRDGQNKTSHVLLADGYYFCEKREEAAPAPAPQPADFVPVNEDEGIPFTF